MLQAERDDWNVSYELGDTWKNARKIKLKNFVMEGDESHSTSEDTGL